MNNVLTDSLEIKKEEIPDEDKRAEFYINYSEMLGSDIEMSEDKEKFNLTAFKIPKDKLESNEIKFLSKNEIVEEKLIELENIRAKETVDNCRFLFLVSSDYVDRRDSDIRGELGLIKTSDFCKRGSLFGCKEILLEDIQHIVNAEIFKLYESINEAINKHKEEIKNIKEAFLFSNETMEHLKITLNDSEEQILEKMYIAESRNFAKKDIELKSTLDKLNSLNPTDENYNIELNIMASEVVKTVPLQNRKSLTKYVARRKLVLEIMDKILKQELSIQAESKRNIDEKLLHNLIFQQSSSNPEASDLWLISEEFIYFKGTSESRLEDLYLDDKKILKEVFLEEEKAYLNSLGERRLKKRPDVLLFPNEGKCIIIEFKNPDVNVSEHLLEISRYASIINNLSKDEFKFNTFYGYLIGEKINADDVLDHDGDFVHASHFDYLYRNSKKINGRFGKQSGSLYQEVIKYSTLLERAKIRNEIFIRKLTENY